MFFFYSVSSSRGPLICRVLVSRLMMCALKDHIKELDDGGRGDKMEMTVIHHSCENYYQATLLIICAGEVWARGCGRGLPSASTTDRPGC